LPSIAPYSCGMKTLSLLAALFAVQSHASTNYVPGELLVKLRSEVSQSDLAQFQEELRTAGAKITREYRLVEGLKKIRLARTASIGAMQTRLESMPSVQYVTRNYLRTPGLPRILGAKEKLAEPELPAAQAQPTGPWKEDPKYWGNYGVTQNGVSEVWKNFKFYGSLGTIIAVVDTGVDYNHKDLIANHWRNAGEIPGNGVDDDGNGYVDDVLGWDFTDDDNKPWDEIGHGTHVAGIAAAVGGNGLGTAGHCARCAVMHLKFIDEESGSDADAISAFEYAVRNGAHVINSSWGGYEESPALEDAFKATDAAGIFNAIAAGNDGKDLSFASFYPARYRLPGGATIAALYEVNVYIPFWSNYGGWWVHLSSAGAEVESTYLKSGYTSMSGTSMASPAVAGDAAFIKSYRPQLSNTDIIKLFSKYVIPDRDSMGKTIFRGRPDVEKIFKSLR
jgi:subtilisin family serine protease